MLRQSTEVIIVFTCERFHVIMHMWHREYALHMLAFIIDSWGSCVYNKDDIGSGDSYWEYGRHSHCPFLYHLVEKQVISMCGVAVSSALYGEWEIQVWNVFFWSLTVTSSLKVHQSTLLFKMTFHMFQSRKLKFCLRIDEKKGFQICMCSHIFGRS